MTSWTVALVAVRCRVPRRLFPLRSVTLSNSVTSSRGWNRAWDWTGGRKAGDRPRAALRTRTRAGDVFAGRWTGQGPGPGDRRKGTGQGTDPLGDLQVRSGGSRSLFFFSPPPLSTSVTSSALAPPCRYIGRIPDPSELLLPACSFGVWGLSIQVVSSSDTPGQEASSLSGGPRPKHIHTEAQHPTPTQHNLAGLRWYAVQGVLGLMGLVWS